MYTQHTPYVHPTFTCTLRAPHVCPKYALRTAYVCALLQYVQNISMLHTLLVRPVTGVSQQNNPMAPFCPVPTSSVDQLPHSAGVIDVHHRTTPDANSARMTWHFGPVTQLTHAVCVIAPLFIVTNVNAVSLCRAIECSTTSPRFSLTRCYV